MLELFYNIVIWIGLTHLGLIISILFYLFLTVTRELTQFVGSSYLLITFALISLLKVPFNLGDAVGGTFLGG